MLNPNLIPSYMLLAVAAGLTLAVPFTGKTGLLYLAVLAVLLAAALAEVAEK